MTFLVTKHFSYYQFLLDSHEIGSCSKKQAAQECQLPLHLSVGRDLQKAFPVLLD